MNIKMAFGKFKQFLKEPLKSTLNFFGGNSNGAIIAAVAIAGFKGLLRPLFTMMDKKSDPQTKKYAAIREGMTELIAIPVYIAVPSLLGKPIARTFYKKESAVIQKAVETNVKFIGVLASTAIIPAICNVVQPPFMNYLKKRREIKLAQVKSTAAPAQVNKPSFTGKYVLPVRTSSKINYGMRVGS